MNMNKIEEIPVSTKIVKEIINYAQNKIDTPFDHWSLDEKLRKTGMNSEERNDMLQTMKNQDEIYKSAMKTILFIIQTGVNPIK